LCHSFLSSFDNNWWPIDTDTDSDELFVEPAPSNDEEAAVDDMGPPQIVMSSSDVVVEPIENGKGVLIL
jgi:hypothetical protein